MDEILGDGNADPSINATPRGRTTDLNEDDRNASDLILVSCESDSNKIDISDSETESHPEPIISTRRGTIMISMKLMKMSGIRLI
jgi:hypothetical protein